MYAQKSTENIHRLQTIYVSGHGASGIYSSQLKALQISIGMDIQQL